MMATSVLDPLDFEILRELQDDGRRAFRDVARALDVPEATVRTRIKRLQDQGILQILAFINPFKLGHARMSLMFVTVDPKHHDAAAETMEAWTEVTYLSTTMGSADLCVQVLCRDDESLWELRQKARNLPGVQDVQLMQEVKVHKIRFTVPSADTGA